jgi:ankyrin repeat protein
MELIDYCNFLVYIDSNNIKYYNGVKTSTDVSVIDILQRVDIDQQNSEGDTALIISCKKGYPNLVKYLIEHGANVNLENKYGNTALICALHDKPYYYEEIVDTLIKFNIDIDHLNSFGDSALSLADAETTILLIENGANVNIQDHNGRTILMKCYKYEYDCLLLDHGIDINIRDNIGRNALIYCKKDMMIDKLFNLGIDYDYLDNQVSSPLQTFVSLMEHGKLQMYSKRSCPYRKYVKRLIEAGVNCTIKCNKGYSVLHKLCEMNSNDVIELCLINGVSSSELNIETKHGRRPFDLLTKTNGKRERILIKFIERGCDVYYTFYNKKTPMILAVRHKYKKLLKILIQKDCGLHRIDTMIDMVRVPLEQRILDKTSVLEKHFYNDVVGVILKY